MGALDFLRWIAGVEPEQKQLTASFEDQLAATQRRRDPQVWRRPTSADAMSVPAIFGIVSAISNTVGMLSLEAYRNGRKLPPGERPQLVVRPDPFRRPGSFFRDSAYNLASRGEAWWWVAKRDGDGLAMSLLNIPPHEIVVEENPQDLRYPIIKWRGRRMRNADMRQITYNREPGDLRGRGPLQMCGAAVSVAVEAQEFAANFYGSGGHASTIIKKSGSLDPTLRDPATFLPDASGLSEADLLREQWVSRPNNVPRVIDDTIASVDQTQIDENGAQMLTTRDFQVGEIARMFSYPYSLIGYSPSGASLTYQNVQQELDKLTRTCLLPFYLEKFEQEISDLLTRTTVARFNVDGFLRADPKTRAEVYEKLIPLKVVTLEEARNAEGYGDGNVETAPVPDSAPQAIPDPMPVVVGLARGPEPLPGRAPIVSKEDVLDMKAKLLAEGRPAGYGSLARALHVSETTIRRRLAA